MHNYFLIDGFYVVRLIGLVLLVDWIIRSKIFSRRR